MFEWVAAATALWLAPHGSVFICIVVTESSRLRPKVVLCLGVWQYCIAVDVELYLLLRLRFGFELHLVHRQGALAESILSVLLHVCCCK